MVMRVLTFTLQEASYMFVHTDGKSTRSKMEASQEAFIFISGTGFDMMVEDYGINLDATRIREKFYDRFNIT